VFVQNRRTHHELGLDIDPRRWLPAAFSALTHTI
jgi:hypothetical protein